jgi:CheY-like chemotaxis protein
MVKSLLFSAGFDAIECDDWPHALSVIATKPCIDLLVTETQPAGVDVWTLGELYLHECPHGRLVLMSADHEVNSINMESSGEWRFVPRLRLSEMLLEAIQSVGLLRPRRVVLLVEDEPLLRNLVQAVLARAGHAVIAAVDGGEALELSRAYSGKIDLVVSDVTMPRMDGLQLTEHIRRERPETPVLLMSGFFQGPVPSHTALIQKPFTPRKLASRVNELLGIEPKAGLPS